MEFFDFKLEKAKEKGLLQTAAGRSAILSECAEILSLMGDFAARENQINMVAAHLQTSATVLRQQIASLKARPKDCSALFNSPRSSFRPPFLVLMPPANGHPHLYLPRAAGCTCVYRVSQSRLA